MTSETHSEKMQSNLLFWVSIARTMPLPASIFLFEPVVFSKQLYSNDIVHYIKAL